MSNEEAKGKEVKTEFFTNMSEQEIKSLIEKENEMEKKEIDASQEVEEKVEYGEGLGIVEVPIDSLETEYHPRKNMGDIERLQGSIKRDGLQEPLLVYEIAEDKYGVIDGCRRLTALKEFGWKTVPCIVRKGIGLREAAHLSFVRNNERKSFDAVEVALHLRAMRERFGYSMRDLEIKGYGSPSAISMKLKLLDLPEEVQGQIRDGSLTMGHGTALTKLPSEKEQIRMAKRIKDQDLSVKRTVITIEKYLKKGSIKEKKPMPVPEGEIPGVYIKDSRDMSELPDDSVHLIVSSPPYHVGMEYEKGMTFDEHIEMVQGVLKECGRVLVKGGILALNVGDIHLFKGRDGKKDVVQMELMGHKYQSWLRKYGISLTDVIIWRKPMTAWTKRLDINFTETSHTAYKVLPNYEPVYIFRKKGTRETPPEDVLLKSHLTKEQWVAWTPAVWDIKPVQNMEGHPSIYPDELCMRLIKMFSYEGDTVLDPFLGSGTTVKVARELNRNAVGYEKEPQYKEVIMKKLGLAVEESADGNVTTLTQMTANIEKIAAEAAPEAASKVMVAGVGEAAESPVLVEHTDDYMDDEGVCNETDAGH